MKKFTVLLLLAFLVGCDSQAYLEKEWLGRCKSALVAMRGTPDEVTSDGFGGEIYTYITVSTYPDYWIRPCWHPEHGCWPRSYYYHGLRRTVTSKTMFWIDPYEKIYNVSIGH